MAKRNTEKIILMKALDLFSVKGYTGVSVADIAAAVGIKAASLYKHFKSKQDIFDSILKEAADAYKQQAEKLAFDGLDHQSDAVVFQTMDLENLVASGMALFRFFLHEKTTAKLRRMLTIEQYDNQLAAELLLKQYMSEPLAYQTAIFASFIEEGFMKDCDAEVAAAHFYSPLYLLLIQCDVFPEKEEEALVFIEKHIKQFNKLYINGGESL